MLNNLNSLKVADVNVPVNDCPNDVVEELESYVDNIDENCKLNNQEVDITFKNQMSVIF